MNILNDIEIFKYKLLGYDINNFKLLDQKFYNSEILYPELKIIVENNNIILNELEENTNKWIKWNLIIGNKQDNWDTIPIYGFNKWSKLSKFFPKSCEIFKKIPNFKAIFFSKLKKNTTLKIHHGPLVSNDLLRNQIGLYVPENCGMWVSGETKMMQDNKIITFDDTKFHTAFNNSNDDRIIIIIDMVRPNFIKKGNSVKHLLYNHNDF